MNDTIIYRPYRSYAWFLSFTIPIGILAFVAAGYYFPYYGYSVLGFSVIGIVCTWLTKVLYDSSNTAVVFEPEGLQIAGGSHNNYRHILWEELPYAYYSRNCKGHLFLVLSPEALGFKEAKDLVNQGANSSRISIGCAVVIHIDVLQNTSQVKESIAAHVLHIDAY